MANAQGSHRLEDRRYHGKGDNNTSHVSKDENDQRGDQRHLKKKSSAPTSAGGRVVPIAATTGGPKLPKADNGGGKRIAPASMIRAGK